jgi:hypothetical protein
VSFACPPNTSAPNGSRSPGEYGRASPFSPIETGGSGHIRVRHALSVVVRNKWLTVEQTVGELRIRLGERARRLSQPPVN